LFKPVERTKVCQPGVQLSECVGHCAVESHCVALADGGGGEVWEVATVREIQTWLLWVPPKGDGESKGQKKSHQREPHHNLENSKCGLIFPDSQHVTEMW